MKNPETQQLQASSLHQHAHQLSKETGPLFFIVQPREEPTTLGVIERAVHNNTWPEQSMPTRIVLHICVGKVILWICLAKWHCTAKAAK